MFCNLIGPGMESIGSNGRKKLLLVEKLSHNIIKALLGLAHQNYPITPLKVWNFQIIVQYINKNSMRWEPIRVSSGHVKNSRMKALPSFIHNTDWLKVSLYRTSMFIWVFMGYWWYRTLFRRTMTLAWFSFLLICLRSCYGTTRRKRKGKLVDYHIWF